MPDDAHTMYAVCMSAELLNKQSLHHAPHDVGFIMQIITVYPFIAINTHHKLYMYVDTYIRIHMHTHVYMCVNLDVKHSVSVYIECLCHDFESPYM